MKVSFNLSFDTLCEDRFPNKESGPVKVVQICLSVDQRSSVLKSCSLMRREYFTSWSHKTVFCLPSSGIHYMGDLLEHKPFRCILDSMTNGQLQWEPLENPFDQVVLGPPENRRQYPIYSGRTRFPEELKKCFPGEEKAIDEYIKLVKVGSFWDQVV